MSADVHRPPRQFIHPARVPRGTNGGDVLGDARTKYPDTNKVNQAALPLKAQEQFSRLIIGLWAVYPVGLHGVIF